MDNEYVFREAIDGCLEFVGDFEGLYKSDIDPWDQSGSKGAMALYYNMSRRRIINAVQNVVPLGLALEIGCGHGHCTALLQAQTQNVWQGLDISKTAVERAEFAYSQAHIRFYCGDIRKPMPIEFIGQFSCVLLNQVIWYVLDDFDAAINNCLRIMTNDGVLIISQGFLNTQQRYGARIVKGFAGLISLLESKYSNKLSLIYSEEIDKIGLESLRLRDGLIVMAKQNAH